MDERRHLQVQLNDVPNCDWPTLAWYCPRLLLSKSHHTEAGAVQQGRSFARLLA